METQPISTNVARQQPAGLWHHRDFMLLWTGQTISRFGSTITREALPYTAILTLHATPLQMGLLGAAGSLPLLLFGMFAGVWVDRMRRRPLMLVADVVRALLLLWIPAAFLLGWLRIEQLYLLAALIGLLSVFFDVAYQAYLPGLVQRDQIMEGNSKLEMSGSFAEITGPPAGGLLVQLIGGPITALFDALSFLFSAVMLWRIRTVEAPPARAEHHESAWHEVGVGMRAVWSHPLLRPMALSLAIRSFFGWFFGAIYGLYAINVLGMSPAVLGLTVACGGIGSFVGAALAERMTRRLGFGSAVVVAVLIGASGSWLIWLAGNMLAAAIPLMMASQLICDMAGSVIAINEISLRQAATPAHILGRVNASMRVLGEGVGALGLLAGGALAEVIGLHATVAVAICGGLLGDALLVCSPLRRLRALPAPPEQ